MIRFRLIKISLICVLFFLALYGKILPPTNIQIGYSEKCLDISWDSVTGAIGYNIYTSSTPFVSKSKKRKINKKLITSGIHFTYIWHFEKKEKVRKIKGYKHYIAVTSVFEINGKKRESGLSKEVNNCYFEDFNKINSPTATQNILKESQKTPLLPIVKYSNSKEIFIKFMEGPGRELSTWIKKNIDPKETGACAPISTILVKLLQHFGLYAFRIDGNFIKEFHTFIIINIDKVEYVLDFTADQFIPNVAPVMVPRDLCFINKNGKFDQSGIPAYSIAKVYSADQVELSDDKSADIYREIYKKIITTYK